MKQFPIYQVDAFADRLFRGNPAAVCFIDAWPQDHLLQSIAAENNLAETAFLLKRNGDYEIRWFTPTVEVDLCGHATLASAFVIFVLQGHSDDEICFYSRFSGELRVRRQDDILFLDFPVDRLEASGLKKEIAQSIGVEVLEVYKGRGDLLAVVESEAIVKALQPDLKLVEALDARGLIVTAKGESVDFVSRFFAPQSGINEDPVTGSAHTTLLPYWYKKTGKKAFIARQLSSRGGTLDCRLDGDRCYIGGTAVLYSEGVIHLPE